MAIVAVIFPPGDGGFGNLKDGKASDFQNLNCPHEPECSPTSFPSSSRAPTKARRKSGALVSRSTDNIFMFTKPTFKGYPPTFVVKGAPSGIGTCKLNRFVAA